MRVSEAMSQAVEDFLDKVPELGAHTDAKDNPHEVTKEQVGLGNVKNEEQLTQEDLQAHAQGETCRHTAQDVDYSEHQTVKEKIDEIVIEGGGGTMYHDQLLNLDAPCAHPATAIENLGEILVFEGETNGDESIVLKSTQESKFIFTTGQYAGNLTMPEGTAANYELLVSCLAVSGSIISAAKGTCLFRTQGGLVRMNAAVRFIGDTISVYDFKSDQNDTTPGLHLSNGGVKTIAFTATGVAGSVLQWRAELRLKNIVDLN